MIALVLAGCCVLALPMANYTWNSNRVLRYFEREETKISRKLMMPYRMKNDKEVYYVRFDLMFLIQEVMSELKLNKNKIEDLDIYTADTFKTVGHGFTAVSLATMLGVPYFFEWKSVKEVDLKKLRHKSTYHFGNLFSDHILTLEDLELTDEEINELKETFVLSDKAKKFAVAQKLIEMESLGDWFFYTSVPFGAAWLGHMMSAHFNDVFKMLERPWFVRYALYSVYASLGLSLVLLLYTKQQNDVDKSADERLILMGRDYLEGGKEFYSKETQRGLLLRKGLGERGKKFYSEDGELERLWYEPQLLGTPHSISTERIKSYVELLA